MPDLWLPGVTRLPDVPSRALGIGLRQDNSTHRIHDWHTFESRGYKTTALAGARYLNSSGKWGHFVWNPVLGGLVQLLPMNVGGWLLRARDIDGDGDLEHTNGWGAVHAGTEVIGDAARPFHLDMTRAGQDDLIRLMNFLRSWSIPDRWAWRDQPPPAYPSGSVKRRNPEQSGHAYHAGYLGNDHGDPGKILAPWIMEKISVVSTPKEPPMTTLLSYPAKSAIKTNAFWTQLEAVMRQEGFTIYCGPSYVRSGACRKGKHGHWDQSRHWVARALDIGRDPNSRTPISQYEKTHLTAKALHLRDLYGSAIGLILDRASDHKDHLHIDDGQSGYQVNHTNDYSSIGDELVYGRKDAKVKQWQRDMTKAGLSLTDDGSFGPTTFTKTKQFQHSQGLRPDGIVGNATQAAMRKKLNPPAPTPTPTPTPDPTPTVKVTRLSGASRYETSALLDKQRKSSFDPRKVYLAATGTDDLALAGGDGRVLSTSGTTLPSATRARLEAIDVTELVIVGGTATISEAVVRSAAIAASK